MQFAWVLVIVAALAGGCATARAKMVPDGPPLEVPEPPPRLIGAVDEPLPATAPEDSPVAGPVSPTPTPPVRPAPRVEVKPETPIEVVLPEAKPIELRTLRAPGLDDAKEKAIRDQLAGASRMLARVDYAKLSRDGKSQYEQSKRFVQQAEQALKDRDLVFAATLSDKAATLAGELTR